MAFVRQAVPMSDFLMDDGFLDGCFGVEANLLFRVSPPLRYLAPISAAA